MEEATVYSFSQFENQTEFHDIRLACNGAITNEEMDLTPHCNSLKIPSVRFDEDAELDVKVWSCSNLIVEYPFTFVDSITHKEIHFHCRMAYQKEDQFYTLRDILDLIDDYANADFSAGEIEHITSTLESELNLSVNQITHKTKTREGKLEEIFDCLRFFYLWGIEGKVFLQTQRDADGHQYLKLFSKPDMIQRPYFLYSFHPFSQFRMPSFNMNATLIPRVVNPNLLYKPF